MASTNKTTNYELSQYIGTDKPTYLTDYNQDMSKIDAGIHAAKAEADTNATAIGDLSSLTTTAKTSLVAAANEIDADVATNTNNIATNTSNIATNTSAIGTLSNLTTTSKTDLVVAANEINAKVGNLASLDTTAKGNTVAAINEVNYNVGLFNLTHVDSVSTSDITCSGSSSVSEQSFKVAYNDDGSLAKIYGYAVISLAQSRTDVSFPSALRPSSNITVNCVGSVEDGQDIGYSSFGTTDLNIATDGTISFTLWKPGYGTYNDTVSFTPVLIFVKDFGDTPQPAPVGV